MRFLPLVAVSLAAAPALAQPPAGNAEVLAAARAFEEAQVRHDRAGLEAAIAPDFLIAQGSGKVTGRADFIDGFTRPGATLEPFTTGERLFLRVTADVAIVGGEQRIAGVDNGRRFARRIRYSDTWVRRGAKWVVVFSQVTPLAG